MIIEKITIGHFGGVKEFECDFTDGINLIEGRNEAGKTTISTFIKFMFYGLSGKAKGGGLSERRKYQSWDTDSADGSIEFSHKGGRYRIERSLIPSARAQGKETVRIIDLATNTECLQGVNPGKYFFGVTEDVFLQTAFVGQADGNTVDGVSVAAAIENMLFAGDEMISTKSAQKKLEEGRTMLLYKNKKGGRIYELKTENEKLSRRLEVARTNQGAIISTQAERTDLTRRLDEGRAEANRLSEKLARIEAQRGMDSFAHLANLDQKLAERQDAYNAYVNGNSFEGFFPDMPYVTALDEKYREIAYAESELARETQRRQDLGGDRINDADRALLEKSVNLGGVPGIEELLYTYRHKTNVSRIFGGVLMGMMAIWAALASVCVFVPQMADLIVTGNLTLKTVGYGVYGMGALFALIGILCFVRGSKFSRKYRNFLAEYNVVIEDDLYRNIETAERRAADQKLYEVRANDLNNNIRRLNDHLGQLKSDAAALLARHNRTFEGKEDLHVASEECRKLLAGLSELASEAGKAKASADAVRRTLDGEDEEKLAQVLARTEWVGEIDEADLDAIQRAYTAKVAENNQLLSTLHAADLELARLDATVENPAALADTIDEKSALMDKLQIQHDALRLACDSIDAAAENLRSGVAPRLSMQASTLMRKGTDGKYETIGVNNQLEMQYGASSGVGYTTRDIDFMSSGTRDLAYISLRLALVGLLYQNTCPPLFFDESFARLDDGRLTSMFGLLREYAGEGSQVFLFTSQHRDAKILASQGEFKHILL